MKTSKLDRLSLSLRVDVSPLASPFIGDISSVRGYSGVYALEFEEGYFYVGKSVNLGSRLDWHLQRNSGKIVSSGGCGSKYQNVTNKHLLKAFYVLEHQPSMFENVLSSRESMWIGIFHKVLGGKKLVNTVYTGSQERRSQNLSPEERALRAARMSKTIREAHKDPVYKAKMKAIARENYANVHPDVRSAARKASSLKHKVSFAVNPNRRKLMADKARKQWEDPEFRRINSERIRKRMREHSSGENPLKRKLRTSTVYILPLNKKFVLEMSEANRLLRLSASSDNGPERKLPTLLSLDFKVVRNDPTPYAVSADMKKLIATGLSLFLAEPFVNYMRDFRDKVGSYRTSPALIRDTSTGDLFRVFSCGINTLRGKGYTLVKTYTSVFQFWKDKDLYPCLGHARDLPPV